MKKNLFIFLFILLQPGEFVVCSQNTIALCAENYSQCCDDYKKAYKKADAEEKEFFGIATIEDLQAATEKAFIATVHDSVYSIKIFYHDNIDTLEKAKKLVNHSTVCDNKVEAYKEAVLDLKY